MGWWWVGGSRCQRRSWSRSSGESRRWGGSRSSDGHRRQSREFSRGVMVSMALSRIWAREIFMTRQMSNTGKISSTRENWAVMIPRPSRNFSTRRISSTRRIRWTSQISNSSDTRLRQVPNPSYNHLTPRRIPSTRTSTRQTQRRRNHWRTRDYWSWDRSRSRSCRPHEYRRRVSI